MNRQPFFYGQIPGSQPVDEKPHGDGKKEVGHLMDGQAFGVAVGLGGPNRVRKQDETKQQCRNNRFMETYLIRIIDNPPGSLGRLPSIDSSGSSVSAETMMLKLSAK